MKKIFNVFLFVGILLCPLLVKASGYDYNDTIHYVNNYIYKFPKYNNYLVFSDRLPFVYENSDYEFNANFKSGGLLS